MPDNTNHTFKHSTVSSELTLHRKPSIRETICAAGLSLLLAISISPLALADEGDDYDFLPDGKADFDDIPSITDDGTSGSTGTEGEGGSGDGGSTASEPDIGAEEPATQEPAYEPEPEPDYSDSGGDDGYYEEPTVEVPDSSTLPYEDYSDYEGSYASNEDAWVDDTPVYTYYEEPIYEEYVEEAEEEGEWIPEAAAPVFGGYDEETRTVYGTATAGYTLRVVDSDGNYIMDVGIAEDGSFSFELPEWYDLANISFFLVNEWGEQVSLDVTGQAMLEQIAAQELAAIQAEVGGGATDIANSLRNSLFYSSLVSSFEAPEEESVNITPYIIGGVAVIVVAGAAVGIGVGVTRSRRHKEERVDLNAQMGAQSSPLPFYEESFVANNAAAASYAPEAPANEVYNTDAYVNAAYGQDAYSPEAYNPEAYSPNAYANTSYGAGDYGYNSYGSYGSYDSYGYEYEAGSLLHPVEEGVFVQSADTTGSLYPVINYQEEKDELDELERLALGISGAAAVGVSTSSTSEDDTDNYFAPPASDTAQPSGGDDDDDPTPPPHGPGGGGGSSPDSTDAFIALVNTASTGTSTTGQNQPRESQEGTSASYSAGVDHMAQDDFDVTMVYSADDISAEADLYAHKTDATVTRSSFVHKVNSSKDDIDLSGLDLFDEEKTPESVYPLADPLVDAYDWQAIAMRELAPAVTRKGKERQYSTTDFIALYEASQPENTVPAGRHFAAAAASAPSPVATPYVAPVIGPSSVTEEEAQRHRTLIDRSAAPEAAVLRYRDEQFRQQRISARAAAPVAASAVKPSQGVQPQAASVFTPAARPAASSSPVAASAATSTKIRAEVTRDGVHIIPRGGESANNAATNSAPSSTTIHAQVTRDGVPIIPRGSQSNGSNGPALRYRSVSESMSFASRSLTVPDLDARSFVEPVAPDPALHPSTAAAVHAASVAYAAYAPAEYRAPSLVTTPPVAAPARQDATSADAEASHALAAAYAAAVYADAVPEPIPEERTQTTVMPQQVPAVAAESRVESNDTFTRIEFSPAYINYMVQDEFEHRHDTIAQRNAALGQMHIVNGAACAPIPATETAKQRRHMA